MGTNGAEIAWMVPEGWRQRFHRYVFGRRPWHPKSNPGTASVWIRGFQVANYLKRLGYTVTCNPRKGSPDVAVFLRRYSAADVERARSLRASGTSIVTDVIVNYFAERQSAQGYEDGVGAVPPEKVRSFRELIGISDQVWCVSPFLRDLAGREHDDAQFVPDSVDPNHFDPAQYDRPTGGFTFGWSGYSAKANHLETLRPILSDVEADLLVISDHPPDIDVPYTFSRWRYDTFPADISRCHLCVAPRRVSDEYHKGHSFFKIGVFMAMGVPALAGPVPSYSLLIGDERGGAICRSLDDWREYIIRITSDAAFRDRWSREATETMAQYSTPRVVERVSSLLDDLVAG